MALVVNVKTVEYLKGKYDRVMRLTFRGKSFQSNVIRGAKRAAYFGQTFEWPVARAVEDNESFEMFVFNYSKYLSDKLLGSLSLSLQHVIKEGQQTLSEHLIDATNKLTPMIVTFEVHYVSPDGQIGDWKAAMSNKYLGADLDENEEEDEDEQIKKEQAMIAASHLLHLEDEACLGLNDDEEGSIDYDNQIDPEIKVQRNYIDMQMDRAKEFELMITIIEAQQLSGLDLDPVIKVTIGERSKYTAIRQSTNCPFFNEYFVFSFFETPTVLFDTLLTIGAYHSYALPGRHIFKVGNIVAAKKLIGEFKCDLGMVYSSPNHQFYHKWAVLTDPSDIEAGAKGYIKCDIALVAKGQQLKQQKIENEDEDNIEGNLLLPAGISKTRHRAVYTINIYRAEDLPQTELGILASMQRVFTQKDLAFIDAFVKVSFVGQIGKSSVIKSYYPEWNESLKFMDMFPPLCNRIKIQLCDDDTVSDGPVSTHFIELSQIMDPSSTEDGILPTFGPSWVNMYGTSRAYKMLNDGTEDLNMGVGEGSAFRGRVLLSLKTSVDPTDMAEGKSKVIKEKLRTGVLATATRKPFLLYCSIFEMSMIDAKFCNKSVYFEISQGQFGNTLDGKSKAKAPLPGLELDDDNEEDNDDGILAGVPALKQENLRKQVYEEINLPVISTTQRKVLKSTNSQYGYIPAEREKPCLFLIGLFEDIRKRHFHSNIIEKIATKLEEGLNEVKDRLSKNDMTCYRRLRGVMEVLKQDCDVYNRTNLGVGAGSGKTKLDQYRLKAVKSYMQKVRDQAVSIRKLCVSTNVKKMFIEVKDLPYKLKTLSKEPQHCLPDVIIWLIVDNQRVAYHRIPAKDLIYCSDEYQCGKLCGKKQTVFLKKPGKKSHGAQGWTVQAKLDVLMWLGDFDLASRSYMDFIPAGFEVVLVSLESNLPPIGILYNETHKFQFRAYMYQARSLIPSDETGLSDPFACVYVCNRYATTQIVFESLSPTWDETLVICEITMFGSFQSIKECPPVVVVEIYDYDTVGSPEFLGRCTASTTVHFEDDFYEPAKLKWWDVYRGPNKSGQLLASFELIEESNRLVELPKVKHSLDGTIQNNITTVLDKLASTVVYEIPPEIKPSMSRYRIEILFRGVRELKRMQLMTIDHPQITVECCGQMKSTERIEDMEKNSNFEEYLHFMDVDLPDDKQFWPSLTIRCLDSRSFGRNLLVGVHTVTNIEQFLQEDPAESEEKANDQVEIMSLKDSVADSKSNYDAKSMTSIGEKSTKSSKSKSSKSSKKSKSSKSDSSPDAKSAADKKSVAGRCSRPVSPLDETEARSVSRIESRASDVERTPEDNRSVVDEDAKLAIENKEVDHDTKSLISVESSKKTKSILSGDGSSKKSEGKALKFNLEGEDGGGGEGGGKGHLKKKKIEKELTPAEEEKKRIRYKELIQELDWWSKYYVSKKDSLTDHYNLLTKIRASLSETDLFEDANAIREMAEYGFSVADFSAMDSEVLHKQVEEAKKRALEAERTREGNKKKRRFLSRKRLRKKFRKIKGKVNKAFKKDEDELELDDQGLLTEEDDEEDSSNYIQKLKVFPVSLEQVPAYHGFSRLFKTFQLFRGKKSDDESEDLDRHSGLFKGQFCVYKLSKKEIEETAKRAKENIEQNRKESQSILVPKTGKDEKKVRKKSLKLGEEKFKLARFMVTNKPVEVKVLVYVVRATELHPCDLGGRSDPYLVIKCGRDKIVDKDGRVNNNLNPIFGRTFEFDAILPMDSILKVEVWDYDTLSDEIIGETTLDLEDRYFSHHMPRCGLQQKYEIFGYNVWRNPLKPSEILSQLCAQYGFEAPVYTPDNVALGKCVIFEAENHEKYEENENGDLRPTIEHMALKVLRNWKEIPNGWPLVPEFVETRSLHCEARPGIEQGKVEMWVDMFPKESPKMPVSIDIAPRKPKGYELRVVVWNTDEVTLDDVNFITGEASSDIFVKGYLKGVGIDDQKTDIHYRSMTGEGNFNWRFIFKFNYSKAENSVVFAKKEHLLATDEVEHKIPPYLVMQVWDADLVSSDDVLGGIVLNLSKMPRPAKSVESCGLKMIELGAKYPTLNLFKNKRCKGWWPVAIKEKPQKEDSDSSSDSEEEEKEKLVLKGKVELELELLTEEEAEREPAGKAHEEPQALPKPNRPDTSFMWFLNPLKTLKYIIWRNYKWVLLKLLIIALIILFLALFFYTFPEVLVRKIMGV